MALQTFTDLEPSILLPLDPAWPRGFASLTKPVAELRVLGTLPDLTHAVAIVGTRAPERAAISFARALAGELASAGCTIVSGGALGIDAAAHEGALEAGGTTVVVLPNFFDAPHPRSHWPLFEQVIEARGALVTEATGPVAAYPPRFLARNRIIVGLSTAVVVVEAGARSGALSTATWAKKAGRPLFAVPHSPWNERGAGCVALLQDGSRVCARAADVLSVAAPGAADKHASELDPDRKSKRFQVLDPDARAVLAALGREPREVDEVCARTQLPADRVHRALLALLLSRAIEEAGAGRYSIAAAL